MDEALLLMAEDEHLSGDVARAHDRLTSSRAAMHRYLSLGEDWD